MQIEPYRVVAFNNAKHGENHMHDDTVAKQYGFGGGLVPGADVYAWMAHMGCVRWGRAFIERGWLKGRQAKPVYEGEEVTISAVEEDGELRITVSVEAKRMICATGTARLPDRAPSYAVGDYAHASPPPYETRVPMHSSLIHLGKVFCTTPFAETAEGQAQYLAEVSEPDPLYMREKIVHFGTLLRVGAWAMRHNLKTGPWIHAGTQAQFLSHATFGEVLDFRGRVVDKYEKNGHKFLELEGLVVADGKRPVIWLSLTNIYEPRQVATAA